ncbi:MAG: DUF423 domain-containing protein [Planctomycetales bacterium]
MNCSRCWLTLGALLAGLAVATGAFAAHGLDRYFHQKYSGQQFEKKLLVDGNEQVVSTLPLAEKYLADFKTAAMYQMYHGLALLVVGLLVRQRPCRWLNVAGVCFVVGCLGFSGGLTVYTLTGAKWIGMTIVPLGGVLFLAGWSTLAIAVMLQGRSPET